MTEVPTYEHTDWKSFDRTVDEIRDSLAAAEMRQKIAEAVEAVGHMNHCFGVSGEEPKWSHPSQREAWIDAVLFVDRLAVAIGVQDHITRERIEKVLSKETAA